MYTALGQYRDKYFPVVFYFETHGSKEWDENLAEDYRAYLKRRVNANEIGENRYRQLLFGLDELDEFRKTGKVLWPFKRKKAGFRLNPFYEKLKAGYEANKSAMQKEQNKFEDDLAKLYEERKAIAAKEEQERIRQEQERQLGVILIPCHQPIRLDVAFPLTVLIARKFVRAILHGQGASGFKQVHRISYVLHVKSALDATAEVLLEAVGK